MLIFHLVSGKQTNAGMAELADAYGSGPYDSNIMRVQVSFPADESASRNRSAFSVRMRSSADKPYRQRGLQYMVLYFIRHGETVMERRRENAGTDRYSVK